MRRVACRCARLRLLMLLVLVPVLTLAGAAASEAATLRVNTTKDEMIRGDHKCSLREAIDAANSPGKKTDCERADAFSNTIVLGAKTYQLSIPPATGDSDLGCIAGAGPVDQNATGDLCVTSQFGLTIAGRGPTTTIAGLPSLNDRLMTIGPHASLSLVALNMVGGHARDGAAAAGVCAPPPLSANNGGNGGAIYNTGSLFTMVVTFQSNSAGTGGAGAPGSSGCDGGSGGAIYNQGPEPGAPFPGSVTMGNTMFIGNVAGAGGAGGSASSATGNGGIGGAGGSGGGIYNASGSVIIRNAAVALNQAGGGGQGGTGGSGGGNGGNGGDGSPGGGIFSTGGSLDVTNGTFAGNRAGAGGTGGNWGGSAGNGGNGGAGSSGGAIAVVNGASGLVNATLQSNILGVAGSGGSGSTAGSNGSNGIAGGIFVRSSSAANNLRLQNSIVASSIGLNCFGNTSSAITNRGHNLSFGDKTCPAITNGDPKLRPFGNYGGYTGTLALAPGSAAINKVPARGANCPATDQRTVKRPQGKACDIGAFEFARPRIQIVTPRNGARYKRGSRVRAFYICSEGGIFDPTITPIASCKGTVANGKRINTSTLGRKLFRVTARDKNGVKTTKTVHYTVVR